MRPHFLRAALLLLAATTSTALADKKTEAMRPGFVKEAAACQIEVRGRAKVITGATALLATLEGSDKEALGKDVQALTAGQVTISAYCSEVEALVAFLEASATSSYKSVENQLDERDNKVRTQRKVAKKLVAELTPITRALIPRLKRLPTPAADDKRAASKFPSGRSVVLPALSGTFSLSGSATTDAVEYVEKAASAKVSTRTFDKATCDQQRKVLSAKSTQISELEVPEPGKAAGVVWSVRFTQEDKIPHLVQVACIARKDGGVVATADVQPAANRALADEVGKLMFAMLAAR